MDKKNKDDESVTQCNFKNECNRKDCKYIHPEKVKETAKKIENNTNAKKVDENKDKADTVINADSVPSDSSSQVFHKGKEDLSQISELRSMILEMSKNVNTLMQERNLYWNWGQPQYYQH